MKKYFLFFICLVAVAFAADMIPANIPASEIQREALPAPDYIEAECVYTGITNYPPWLDYGRDAPWSTAVQIPDVYSRADQVLSMAKDANGRIYVVYETSWNGSQYGWGIATSIDNGATWDNRVRYVNNVSYDMHSPEISITDDGKIWIWGTLTHTTATIFTNAPAFMRSKIGWYNNPDSLSSINYFSSLQYRTYPEVVTWGNGGNLIISQYTVDRTGTAGDSVMLLFSQDTISFYSMSFRPSGGYPGMTSISVDVSGNDTILIHGIEYYETAGADWDIVCFLDTLNSASGGLYGWSTGNTNGDRYPSVFASQGYAYIAYQGDVGSGNNDIMFNNSTNYGASWGGIGDLTNNTANEIYPRLSGQGPIIGVDYVYNSNRVQFNYSVDGGGVWLTTPELVDNNSTVSGAYHSVALLYTSAYWHAAWQDTRNSGTEGIDIYTSRRIMGQGDITHRPSVLTFDYSDVYWGKASSEKYVLNKSANPIDDKLAETMARSTPDEKIPVLVMLSKQLNYDWLVPRAEQMSKPDRRRFVIEECQQLANEDQKALLEYLTQKEKEGKVSDVLSLWSTNTIAFNAETDIIREIANRNDVWCIGNNEKVQIIGDLKTPEPTFNHAAEDAREICWGVSKINADDVWGLGYTGAGVVVGHMDTGVNYNHGDLHDHIWDGSSYGFPNHGYDYVNEDNNPMDDNGHGTATAGIVAGDGTNGSQTGVAPDAQIMALKCDGFATDMDQAIQFGLTYGADLFSTSLGFPNPSSSTKNWGRGQANIIYAAGLVWCASAGNGNGAGGHYTVPQDIGTPADVPSPYYAPNGGNSAIIAVGATTIGDVVDTYSSYGPTSWNTGTYTDYPYPPGLMKPDVAAPGSNCKSLDYATNNGYTDAWYGTSFSQPHVAGTVALMLSRNPALTPRQIDSLLQTTAVDIGTAGRDNYSGAGRIDAYQAVLGISVGSKFQQLRVINQSTATGILQVTGITKDHNSAWLVGINPTTFNVPINDSVDVWVSTDTTGQGMIQGRFYYDTLLIASNTIGDHNPERVPVTLIYMGIIGAEEQDELVTKPGTILLSISPNPFKTMAEFAYTLPVRQQVNLAIYDVSGKKVKTLFDGYQDAGLFTIPWSGNDDKGQPLAAGVYFGRIEIDGQVATNKLILMK